MNRGHKEVCDDADSKNVADAVGDDTRQAGGGDAGASGSEAMREERSDAVPDRSSESGACKRE